MRSKLLLLVVCAALTVGVDGAALAQPAPAAPKLEFAFELRVRVGDPIEIGQVSHGRRRIVPILGGSIAGPLLKGSVPPGGADWQMIQPDGFSELDTRYTIQTEKGEIVYVQNAGIRTAPPEIMQKLLAGQPVDPSLVYFRTVPKFETAVPELQWLARSVFVGVGERYPSEVVIRFFRVD